jgi:hypothetical protein
VRAIVFISEEVLQRSEQKGAHSALLPIRATQRLVFHQVDEERLHEILRVIRRVAAMAQKRIERRAIRLTGIRQRIPRRFRGFRIRGQLNHAPVRRSKRTPPSCNVPGIGFVSGAIFAGESAIGDKKIEISDPEWR